jgi:hypothetical protein
MRATAGNRGDNYNAGGSSLGVYPTVSTDVVSSAVPLSAHASISFSLSPRPNGRTIGRCTSPITNLLAGLNTTY